MVTNKEVLQSIPPTDPKYGACQEAYMRSAPTIPTLRRGVGGRFFDDTTNVGKKSVDFLTEWTSKISQLSDDSPPTIM
jgi:hypothetical protein